MNVFKRKKPLRGLVLFAAMVLSATSASALGGGQKGGPDQGPAAEAPGIDAGQEGAADPGGGDDCPGALRGVLCESAQPAVVPTPAAPIFSPPDGPCVDPRAALGTGGFCWTQEPQE